MDLNGLVAAVQHNGLITGAAGFAGGLAMANYALIIQKIVQSSLVTSAIRKNPALAKAIVAELQKDVEAVADAAPVVAAPGPVPHS